MLALCLHLSLSPGEMMYCYPILLDETNRSNTCRSRKIFNCGGSPEKKNPTARSLTVSPHGGPRRKPRKTKHKTLSSKASPYPPAVPLAETLTKHSYLLWQWQRSLTLALLAELRSIELDGRKAVTFSLFPSGDLSIQILYNLSGRLDQKEDSYASQ